VYGDFFETLPLDGKRHHYGVEIRLFSWWIFVFRKINLFATSYKSSQIFYVLNLMLLLRV